MFIKKNHQNRVGEVFNAFRTWPHKQWLFLGYIQPCLLDGTEYLTRTDQATKVWSLKSRNRWWHATEALVQQQSMLVWRSTDDPLHGSEHEEKSWRTLATLCMECWKQRMWPRLLGSISDAIGRSGTSVDKIIGDILRVGSFCCFVFREASCIEPELDYRRARVTFVGVREERFDATPARRADPCSHSLEVLWRVNVVPESAGETAQEFWIWWTTRPLVGRGASEWKKCQTLENDRS